MHLNCQCVTCGSCNLVLCYLTLVRVTVFVCRDSWPPVLTCQSSRCSIHSRRERKRKRPQEPLCSLTCATSLSPYFLCAPAFAETYIEPALCSTYNHNLCIMHTLHGKTPLWIHTNTQHCCILCDWVTVWWNTEGLLVSSPHPPPYREKLHHTGVRHFHSDGTLSLWAQTSVCAHWCGLFETLILVFPFFTFLPPIFLFDLFDPKQSFSFFCFC